jgi:NtrC-family two-component system sensor histidine kinase KinB
MIFSLRKKILLGYGIALLLTAVVLVWAVFDLSRLGKASDAILRENYVSIHAGGSMITALEEQNAAVLLMLAGYGTGDFSSYRANEVVFLRWLGRARDNITERGEGRIVADIDSAYAVFLERVETLRFHQEKYPESALLLYSSSIVPSFRAVHSACVRLREINQNAMYHTSAVAGQVASNAIISMLIIGAAAILIGLGFSVLLANFIARPLRRFASAARDIAAGTYDVALDVGSSDELGGLAREFTSMANTLKEYRNLNISRMIAEKKKSDAIIRNMDDGLIFVDTEYRVINMNPAAAEIFGANPAAAEGRHILEIVRSEELFEQLKRAAESGETSAQPESGNLLTFDHGETREHYQFSIVPVRVDSGSNAGVLLILRDVTRLKELDMLKSQFVMTASHELRTPLTSALLSIDLLAENAPSRFTEKETELLNAARQELHRLRSLVDDLLELSRIESGKIDLTFESIDISALIESAVNLMQKQGESRGIELSYRPVGILPPVKADPNKVMWVLTNLVSNALRYTDSGGWIRVAAEPFGAQVHISVADNGIGIPHEYHSRIFDKFVQIKSDRGNGGTGLGLAICREIVRAHGGTIWVESAPGQGSRFTFTLPVIPEKKKEVAS